MKPGGGKVKGSAFERWVAKELSLWCSGGKSSGLFWRTHSSGMLGTRNKMKQEYGDIMAVGEEGAPFVRKYNIECRHSKSIRISDLIYKDNSGVHMFIQEGLQNARLSGRIFIGFVKESNKEVLVIIDYYDIDDDILVKGIFGRWAVVRWSAFKKVIKSENLLKEVKDNGGVHKA